MFAVRPCWRVHGILMARLVGLVGLAALQSHESKEMCNSTELTPRIRDTSFVHQLPPAHVATLRRPVIIGYTHSRFFSEAEVVWSPFEVHFDTSKNDSEIE